MPKVKAPAPEVRLDENDPEPTVIIAKAIIEISEAMERINRSGLKRRALVALIHDNSKLPKRDIDMVLNNLEFLKQNYVN